MNVGEIRTNLTASSEQLQRTVNDAEQMLKDYEQVTDKQLNKAEGRWRSFGRTVSSNLNQMKRSMGDWKVALAGTVGAAGLGYMINRTLAAQQQLYNLHKTTGVSIRKIQEYQFAMRKAGIEQQSFNDALIEMVQRMGEATKAFELTGDIDEMGRGFQFASISMRELQRLNPTQTFNRLADAIQNAESEQAALNIAVKTFGEEDGRAMVTALYNSGDAIDRYIQQAHRLGIVLDEEIVKQSVEAKKSITTLTVALESQFARIVGELSPQISEAADDMADWIAQNEEFLTQDVPKQIGDIAEGVGDVVGLIDDLPEGAMGAAGMGIVGWMLFGPTGGAIIGICSQANSELENMHENLMDIFGIGEKKPPTLWENLQNIWRGHPKREDEQEADYRAEIERTFRGQDIETTKEGIKVHEEQLRIFEREVTSIGALAARYDELQRAQRAAEWEKAVVRPPSIAVEVDGADDAAILEQWRRAERTRAMAPPSVRWGPGEYGAYAKDDLEMIKQFDDTNNEMSKFEKSWQDMLDNTAAATQNWQGLVTNSFGFAMDDMSSALTNFVMTGEMQWEDFAGSVIKSITQMMIKWMMWEAVKAGIKWSSWGGSGSLPDFMAQAQGAAFDNGQVMQYAQGGIVNQPTVFPMASGAGVMGEDGPEAVMPLERTASGDLGVQATGQSAPPVDITIVNNLGEEAEAKQQGPKFDGQRWVMSIVLDAVNRNQSGFGKNLKGALSKV